MTLITVYAIFMSHGLKDHSSGEQVISPFSFESLLESLRRFHGCFNLTDLSAFTIKASLVFQQQVSLDWPTLATSEQKLFHSNKNGMKIYLKIISERFI